MFCSRCGFKNADGALFCKNCGARMQQGAAVGSSSAEGQRQMGANSGFTNSLGGANARLIKVAVCAAVVIIVGLVAFARLGSSGGCSTGVQLTQRLSDSYNSCFASDLDEKDVKKLCDDMASLMPDEVIRFALEKRGVTDASQASSLLSDEDIDEMVSSFKSFIGKVDVDCQVRLSDDLDEGELKEINTSLEKEGLAMRVKAGNKLEIKIDVKATEDLSGMAKGETATQTADLTGMKAVNIDGRWYLWFDSAL